MCTSWPSPITTCRSTSASALLLVCGCLALSSPGSAATIHFFDGEATEGRLELSARGFTLAAKGNPPPVELARILEIYFHRSPVPPGTLPPGAVLTNGTSLPDNTTRDLGRDRLPELIEATAWLLFTPLPLAKIEAAPSGQIGGLLPNGDFFPGNFLGYKGGRVSLNSTLFGPQTFTAKSQINAVCLRDAKFPPARFIVTTVHGSRFLTEDLQPETGAIAFKDSVLGQIRLKADELAEIRSGPGRYQWLTDLPPVKVLAPPGVDPASVWHVEKGVLAEETSFAPPILTAAANTAIPYNLPAGFSTFTAGLSVPASTPAAARVTFAVYGDGRPLAKSAAAGPSDKPPPLHVDVRAVHALTLRVETSGLSAGISGEWRAPVLLR